MNIEKNEERIKAIEEIEYLKTLDGHCDHCGCTGATYRVNPFYYEMYGDCLKEWFCDDCYNDTLGDI